MHPLRNQRWTFGLCILLGGAKCAVIPPAEPVITPKAELDDIWVKRQLPDAISFAQILLTAIPLSLRQIAATNAPAVSSILWEEFLDDNRPQWFLDLPWDVQSYLVRNFGPSTASIPASPTTSGLPATQTQFMWTWPTVASSQRNSKSASSSLAVSRSSDLTSVITSQTSSPSSATDTSSTDSSPSHSLSSVDRTRSATLVSASEDPASPPVRSAGLTKHQKIGLGVGMPLGLLGAAVLLLGCCILLRRKRNKRVNGTEPPSSPGFIPRFAFHDKSTNNIEHQRPLNRSSNHST